MTKIKNVIGSILLELGNFNKDALDKVFYNKIYFNKLLLLNTIFVSHSLIIKITMSGL